MKNKNKKIRLSKSCISDKEINSVKKVLEKEFLGMGEEVKLFEEELTKFFSRNVVCVTNGTAALQLSIQAVNIKEDDEILIQSLTYLASVQAIAANKAKPVFCDVYPETLTIDLNDAEKKLTNKTRAIMPVHYAGGVGDLNELYKFAELNGLRVIEDSAHAFGSIYKGKKVGSFGDIACFSFDGIKNITSGEGGCIVSNDEKVIQNVKDFRLLGIHKDSEKRYINQRSWEFDVNSIGWRYHMSNIMGAIGLEQLKRFPELSEKRKNFSEKYYTLLEKQQGISLLNIDYKNVVMHIFPILLNKLHIRESVQKELQECGIETGFHYYPNHLLTYFSSDNKCNLEVTEQLYPRLLTLPLHPDLSENDIEYIVDNLTCILNKDN